MNYNVMLTAKGAGKVHQCFAPEAHASDRSAVTIAKKNKDLAFTIQAQDAVALRASTNSIIKLITVYEKLRTI